ncbi:MAG: mechanosensitive ion channel [Bacteroidales bacterium]|nr:mechanosensitive ion channel [Bacteroidales bacterium]
MREESSFFNSFNSVVRTIFESLGISPNVAEEFECWIFILFLFLVSIFLSWLLHLLIIFLVPRILKRVKGRVVKLLFKHNTFSKLVYVFPPIFILPFLPFASDDYPKFISITERICWIYLIASFTIYLNYLLGIIWHILNEGEKGKNIPLHGLIQLVKGVILVLGFMIILSIIIDKSPLTLITGLGAFAAVLMLVFKDTILGLVAGVQLMQNDVVRKGDWITTPDEKVNGIIEDITLNTVKVRNFDNTIVTVPPYLLISSTLQNWRAMKESGGRRIKITFIVEGESIQPISLEQLNCWRRFDILSDFIDLKEKERRGEVGVMSGDIYGTIDTNLGLFRAYIQLYINQHQLLSKSMLSMVRILDPTENGIPLQVYCFSVITEWKGYEAVRSEITEYLYSVSRMFGLRIFQNASGYHYLSEAYITIGKNIPQ